MDVSPQGNPAPQAGQGNPSPEGGQGSGETQTLTAQEVNELVNRAITSRTKSLEAKFEKGLSELTNGFGAKFDEFAKMFEASKPKPPEPKPDDKGKQQPSIKDAPEYQELLKQVDVLKRSQDAAQKAAEAERREKRDMSLRQKLAKALADAGVNDASRADLAVGILIDAKKHVRYMADDSDDIVFQDAEGETDLTGGIKRWVKSDAGKVFLPPRGTNGSGDRGGGSAPGARPGNGLPSKREIGEALVAAFHNA